MVRDRSSARARELDAESERAAAGAFARMARQEGVGRVVYLGGLGDRPQSKHLRSRHETAKALDEHGPPLTYFRASMVVGAQSESYRTLRFLARSAGPRPELRRHARSHGGRARLRYAWRSQRIRRLRRR